MDQDHGNSLLIFIMNNLKEYIIEKLKLNKDSGIVKTAYHPETKEELIKLLHKLVRQRGEDADLNDIDVSAVTDMSDLFNNALSKKIRNIDISNWDVSNVIKMRSMFSHCANFDCDLSKWDVHNVIDMQWMFDKCSKFKGKGIENWEVNNVIHIAGMFSDCLEFDADLSDWELNKDVYSLRSLFYRCYKFTGKGLENWNISKMNIRYGLGRMFDGCKSLKNKPLWYHE